MPDREGLFGVLLKHFFRRFFDNDTLQVDGDTTTTVVRALAIVAAPSLLVAFFLQNEYPKRDMWGRVEDQYFFVLLCFVVIGAVTIFEWEMLFPDRADFLVLTPLPLRTRLLMVSKATALCCFIGLFLVGSSLFGAVVYPAICKDAFFRQIAAHVLAVTLAGLFIAMALLGLGAALRCLVSDRLFRVLTPVIQTVMTAYFVLLVIQYARYAHSLHVLLLKPELARWFPPLWFLAVYNHALYGAAAPPFAAELTPWAFWSTLFAAVLVLVSYQRAWLRMSRASLEGGASQSGPARRRRYVQFLGARRPQQRAMLFFIAQTLRRNARYQVYLSMYSGAGLAFALACGVVLQGNDRLIAAKLSPYGLHAVFPLLCFWSIAGLRTAFAFPVQLTARWVFRVSGVDPRDLASAGKRWSLLTATLLLLGCFFVLMLLGWNLRQLTVQALVGGCLVTLLTDSFFHARSVPLTQPRLPGRSNFVLALTLYVGVLTPFLFGVVAAELRLEAEPWLLVPVLAVGVFMHFGLMQLQRGPMESEEEMEGYEGEFQLLNLS